MNKIIVLIALSLMLIFVPHIQADVLLLKNGDRLTGKLINIQDGLCSFVTVHGSPNFIPSNELLAIKTDDIFEVIYDSGERITGQLDISKKNSPMINSKNFGVISIQPTKITAMTRYFSDKNKIKIAAETNDNIEESAYGSKPEENPPLDFLTGSTVLLSPGTYEFEVDLNYQNSRTEYSLGQVGYFERSSYSARSLEVGVSLRGGITDDLEAWVRVPYNYTRIEDVSTSAWHRDAESYHLGDIGFGLQYLINRETADMPAISVSLAAKAPTGQKHYRYITERWRDPLDNGSGHWSLSPGLSFVRTTDPAILFGGINYTYSFSNNIDGFKTQPGWSLSGYLGVGFALNEKLSLSSRVAYGYVHDMKADNKEIKGSSHEPMDLSFVASYRLSDYWIWSPQVTFGLNDDSGTPSLSMRFTRRFK